MYSHRNGETDYPAEAGAYWKEHPISHELRTIMISQLDIEFAILLNQRSAPARRIGGYFKYYGPIPLPDVEKGK